MTDSQLAERDDHVLVLGYGSLTESVLDELESEVERLEERNEELAEDREFGERIAAALERIQRGESGDGEASAELAGEITHRPVALDGMAERTAENRALTG